MDPTSSGGAMGRSNPRGSIVCATIGININSFIPKNKYRTSFSRLKATDKSQRSQKNTVSEDNSINTLGYGPSSAKEDSSAFWLRNACQDGLVVVKEKSRVLAQHEGFGKHHFEGRTMFTFNKGHDGHNEMKGKKIDFNFVINVWRGVGKCGFYLKTRWFCFKHLASVS